VVVIDALSSLKAASVGRGKARSAKPFKSPRRQDDHRDHLQT
jgi:hypothetical protein